MKFEELPIRKEVLQMIKEKGFESATDIQSKIIPLILEGKDVLGQSQTGTGKTLAFATAILTKIVENKKTQALILAPTRELAIQIEKEIEELGKYTSINAICVYGSSSIENQINGLKKGKEIVIGTPGRVKDLIKRKVLNLNEINFFVLDEADEMLSMGFQEELESIFSKITNEKQVLLFSATMPKTIKLLAENYMKKDYSFISVIQEVKTSSNIKQYYYVINDKIRIEAMCRIMDYYNSNRTIVFCRTKKDADQLLEKLSIRGYNVDLIHGDITQSKRIATLDRFKRGDFNYLIATDVAARGIHVDDVEVVINYNLPESHEAYVHRIGRTGRVNKSGIAITFIRKREIDIIHSLERNIKTKLIEKNIPSLDEIIKNKLEIIIEKMNTEKDNNVDKNYFSDYLNELSEIELKNILSHFLQDSLSENLGSDFNINLKENEKTIKSKKRFDDDSIRVFATIGKMDDISKKDLLDFLEKKSGIPSNTCFNVEIMTKFTFMNVKKEYYEKLLNKCNNIKYKKRIIRIEKAKN